VTAARDWCDVGFAFGRIVCARSMPAPSGQRTMRASPARGLFSYILTGNVLVRRMDKSAQNQATGIF
tara:strand:- start:101 stop:301 length:201 start_codon:yes stop_codon:yes gene_type:complete